MKAYAIAIEAFGSLAISARAGATVRPEPRSTRHSSTASPQVTTLTENGMRMTVSAHGLEVMAKLVDVSSVERLIRMLEANKEMLRHATE